MNTWLKLAAVVSMIWVVALWVASNHQMKLLKEFHYCKVSDPTFEEGYTHFNLYFGVGALVIAVVLNSAGKLI